ncbi:MAG: carboxypeptidase M32 [Candidatus Hodarchaeales archaeon]|jgi:carboxypeptidase Taq
MTLQEDYDTLLQKNKKAIIYQMIQAQLGWDFETYMPSKGGQQRSMQFATLAADIHTLMTDPTIGELLNSIKNDTNYFSLTEAQKRNLFLIEKEYNRQTKIPADLVKEIAKHQVVAIETWKKAKAEKNYELFKPELKKALDLQKQRAHYLDPNKHPYDVLLDIYEPNMTSAMITDLFNELKKGLVPLINKIRSAPNQPDTSFLSRECPIPIQEKLATDLSNVVHYDLDRGRIDTTEHPFTTGYYQDVRITTHYYENEFDNALFSTMHEAGHAIYEQNLDEEFMYQPLGQASSLGLHESQSRFFENIIGRSPEFWEYYLPRFKELTGDIFDDIDSDKFLHAINHVKPSKIRVTADEVTYSLHVIIRFEIERDLSEGKITVDELPLIWNQKYKEYLGVDIEDDSEGVMQDTHWAAGLFGYFPTYALGNIYNAHQLHVIRKELPNYDELVRTGNLKPILEWLTKKVHKPASLYDPADLMQQITNEPINTKYFIEYCIKKYSQIYGF